MKIRAAAGTFAFAILLAIPTAGVAQTARDLVGTWKGVSNVNIAADGKRTAQFGPKGTGMAMFTSDGHFMIINNNPETPKFAANNRMKGTPEENTAAMTSSLALYGTYKVVDKTLELDVQGSTYPNWNGAKQKRDIAKLSGDDLVWTVTGGPLGGTVELTWKRIR